MPESGGDSDTGETHFQHTGEPTPSRYARQPLPEEGARMWGVSSVSIPPSFGRRCPQGGGWATQSGVKKERLKSMICESTLSTADAVPLPRWGRLRGATLRVDFYKGRCPKVVFKSWVTSHNNDTSRPLETEVPQRDFRVWPNPKRRLACPLRCLPMRPNGPRRRRRIEGLGEA